jgi:hypothetical protein
METAADSILKIKTAPVAVIARVAVMAWVQFAAPSRRDEVDRVFGDGHAAAHPELVVAIVLAASSDWAARVICAALEDTPRRNAGRSRSLAPVFNPWLSARSTPRLLASLRL